MKGFFRKSKESGAVATNPTQPKAKGEAYRPRGIETICPEAGSHQREFYLAPAQALGERLKDFPLIISGGENQPTRLQWQFAIAMEAINTLDNYPLQAIVNVHGDDKWDFHRAVFLRGLTAGLGEWLNKHQLKNNKGNLIDVMTEGWSGAVSVAPAAESFLAVSGGLAEWLLTAEIATPPRDYLHPDVYRLFVDSFGADYHRRNPIAGAVQQAREKMIKRLTSKGIAVDQAVGVIPAVQAKAPAPSPAQTPSASPAEPAPVDQPVQQRKSRGNASKPHAPAAKSKPSGPSSQDMKKAGIAMDLPPKKESKPPRAQAPTPAPAPSNGNPLNVNMASLVDVVRQRMASGIIKANEAGAIFHGTPNGPAIIVPKGYDVIAQVLRVEMADVEAFGKSTMIDPSQSFPKVTYRLRRQGRGWAKIKACVLKPEIASQLFPEGLAVNSDIKVDGVEP